MKNTISITAKCDHETSCRHAGLSTTTATCLNATAVELSVTPADDLLDAAERSCLEGVRKSSGCRCPITITTRFP